VGSGWGADRQAGSFRDAELGFRLVQSVDGRLVGREGNVRFRGSLYFRSACASRRALNRTLTGLVTDNLKIRRYIINIQYF